MTNPLSLSEVSIQVNCILVRVESFTAKSVGALGFSIDTSCS